MKLPFGYQLSLERRSHLSPESPLSKPSDWLINLFEGPATDAGVSVSESSALNFTVVFAAQRILAESVAQLPLDFLERLEKGRRKATNNPLWDLVHNLPNPEMTSYQWRETVMHHLAGWGNSYSEIVRNGRQEVIELWPLLPDRTKPIRTESGQLLYETRDAENQTVRLLARDVLHIPGLSFDGLKGYSPIAKARQAIGLGIAVESFGARFFSQGAAPSGVMEHPGKLSENARENLRESFNKVYQGLSGAHRTAVLEEGMKYHQIGIPPDDAQFLETRKFQVEEIARIYRIPPHMLAQLDKATFSNIEQQSIDFVRNTLLPWLVRIEQALNWKLLNQQQRKRFFFKHNVDGALRGDFEGRMKGYAIARQWGIFSINKVLELEDMNPIGPEGDVHMVPLNMGPATAAPAEPAPSPIPAARDKPNGKERTDQ